MTALPKCPTQRPWLSLFRTDFVALADLAWQRCQRNTTPELSPSEPCGQKTPATNSSVWPLRDVPNQNSHALHSVSTAGDPADAAAHGHGPPLHPSVVVSSGPGRKERNGLASISPEGTPSSHHHHKDDDMHDTRDELLDNTSLHVHAALAAELPAEVLRNIFSRLEPEALSCAAQACIHWRAVAYEPALWRVLACSRIWPNENPELLVRMLWTPRPPHQEYKTWRRLVIHRPHLRYSGIYVRRHQYAKYRRGVVVDRADTASVLLVTYYRLLRFFPNGTVLSLTSPEPPERAYRRLRPGWQPQPTDAHKVYPNHGSYELAEETQTLTVTLPMAPERLYPNMMNGAQYLTLKLSGTHPGAYNRLYLRDHFAIMDNGELVQYHASPNDAAWRFVPLHGFRTKVYDHFPKEANVDGRITNWPRLQQAAPLESANC